MAICASPKSMVSGQLQERNFMSGTFVKQSLAPIIALGCRLVPTLKYARLKMDAMPSFMHGGHKSPAHLSIPAPLFQAYKQSTLSVFLINCSHIYCRLAAFLLILEAGPAAAAYARLQGV